MTLDYTTAKALKDAGFPQEKATTYFVNQEGQIITHEERWGGQWHTEDDMGLICAIPTLSEIIKKLGMDFEVLYENSYEDWWAGIYNWHDLGWVKLEKGKSPELACANLYLSIHKK